MSIRIDIALTEHLCNNLKQHFLDTTHHPLAWCADDGVRAIVRACACVCVCDRACVGAGGWFVHAYAGVCWCVCVRELVCAVVCAVRMSVLVCSASVCVVPSAMLVVRVRCGMCLRVRVRVRVCACACYRACDCAGVQCG